MKGESGRISCCKNKIFTAKKYFVPYCTHCKQCTHCKRCACVTIGPNANFGRLKQVKYQKGIVVKTVPSDLYALFILRSVLITTSYHLLPLVTTIRLYTLSDIIITDYILTDTCFHGHNYSRSAVSGKFFIFVYFEERVDICGNH